MAMTNFLRVVLMTAAIGLMGCEDPPAQDPPAAAVPGGLAGTWRFTDVVSPLPAGVTVPPPVRQRMDQTKSRLQALMMIVGADEVRLRRADQSIVSGPITFLPDGANSGRMHLPGSVAGVVGQTASEREVPVTWTSDTLRLQRPEGTLVFTRTR